MPKESALKSMILDLNKALAKVKQLMSKWVGIEDKGTLTCNNDIDLLIGNKEVADWLLKALAMNTVTQKTVLAEAKKINYLSDSVDVENEILETEEKEEMGLNI